MENASHAIKIQALWRGYRSRKGQVLPCYCCGYDMTLKAPSATERMSAVFYSNAPCSWCQECAPCACRECVTPECRTCGEASCPGDCEPYIPCCICGANCEGGDYEKYRLCSRRCMVRGWKD